MLIGFVGAPISGKTTVAAQVFAELKKAGMGVEFCTERARFYIASKRFVHQSDKLCDEDQVTIFWDQLTSEKILSHSVGERGVVVSDSCPLNTLFYIQDPEIRQNLLNQSLPDLVSLYSKEANSILYFCDLLIVGSPFDPNRIHNIQQSKEIHSRMKEGFDVWATLGLFPNPRPLIGPLQFRTNDVLRDIYTKLS